MFAILAFAATQLGPAIEQRRIAAPEARQGVAADARWVYAIDNSAIARYDKRTGERVAAWQGNKAHFPHLNSCTVHRRQMVCASSNYPALPMASSIEIFDLKRLRHVRSHSLPPMPGSLTVIDWHRGSWWAVFANYDGRGGEPGRGSKAGFLARLDRDFAVLESWQFPVSLIERLAPHHVSGASWGKDGLLYASGHDKPELYVLRLPPAGSTLEHVATIAVPTPGQAIDWDDAETRLLWGVDRAKRSLVASAIPPVLP